MEARPITRDAGFAAEERAARVLESHGLTVIGRNFRCRQGEIDLIARDGAQVVFVEVRARRRSDYGSALESITPRKRKRLIHAARLWIARHGEHTCRFDVVALQGEAHPIWIRDAFPVDGAG